LLQRVRKLVAIRKTYSALQASADLELLYSKSGLYPLVYKRGNDNQTFIITINPSSRSVSVELPHNSAVLMEGIYGPASALSLQNGMLKIQLPGISGGIYRVR
jgi:hypothetical protein